MQNPLIWSISLALEPPASVGGCSSSEGGELIGEEFCNGLETAQKQSSSFTPCPGKKQALLTKIFVNLDKSNCFHAESFMGRRTQLFMENLDFEKLWMLFEGALCFSGKHLLGSSCECFANFFWLTQKWVQVHPCAIPIALQPVWALGWLFGGKWNSLCESSHTHSVLRATNTCTWKET